MGGRPGFSDAGLSRCRLRSEVGGLTKWACRGTEWAEDNSQAREHDVLRVTSVNERQVVFFVVLASEDSTLMTHVRKVLQSSTRWHLHSSNECGPRIKIVQ